MGLLSIDCAHVENLVHVLRQSFISTEVRVNREWESKKGITDLKVLLCELITDKIRLLPSNCTWPNSREHRVFEDPRLRPRLPCATIHGVSIAPCHECRN